MPAQATQLAHLEQVELFGSGRNGFTDSSYEIEPAFTELGERAGDGDLCFSVSICHRGGM